MANVAPHLKAHKVTVPSSNVDDSYVQLQVIDNDKRSLGYMVMAIQSLSSPGMKERSAAFGINLSIPNDSQKGTRVVLKIPKEKGKSA